MLYYTMKSDFWQIITTLSFLSFYYFLHFAHNYYKSVVEINFVTNPAYMQAFKNNNPSDIVTYLSILNPNFQFIPNQTLLFFDEIQEYLSPYSHSTR